MFPQLFLASAILVASIGAPQLTPQTIPAPTLSSTPVPEIGRVRSATPPCSVLKDVIVPGFLAARTVDGQYAKLSTDLAKYVDAIDDTNDRFGPIPQMLLHRLDQSVTNMIANVQTITKALHDPRLNSNDPQIAAQRNQLEQLQENQLARTSLLFEFVQRQQIAFMKNDTGALFSNPRHPVETPAPTATPYSYTQPHLTGSMFTDATVINDWTGGIRTEIAQSEDKAARTFINVQRNCGL